MLHRFAQLSVMCYSLFICVCCAKNITWHSRQTAVQLIWVQAQGLGAYSAKLNTTRQRCVRRTFSKCFKPPTQLTTFTRSLGARLSGADATSGEQWTKPLVGPEAVNLSMLRHCMWSNCDFEQCSGWYLIFARPASGVDIEVATTRKLVATYVHRAYPGLDIPLGLTRPIYKMLVMWRLKRLVQSLNVFLRTIRKRSSFDAAYKNLECWINSS